MSTNVYYTLYTQESQHIVNAVLDEWPSITIGERASLTVRFGDDGDLTIASGETYTVQSDTAEFFEDVFGEDNSTLTIEDDAHLVGGSQEHRHAEVLDYGEFAGHASTGLGLNTVPHFTEQIAADAPITSLVIGVEPGPKPASRDREGFWGLLTGLRDTTNSALTRHAVELDLWVLAAPFDEYSSVAGLKSDLEA